MREKRDHKNWKKQIRRWLVITIGFGLLPVGLILMALPFLPGGTLVTLASLAILANEFAWARRLLNRIKDWLRKIGRAASILSKKAGLPGIEVGFKRRRKL